MHCKLRKKVLVCMLFVLPSPLLFTGCRNNHNTDIEYVSSSDDADSSQEHLSYTITNGRTTVTVDADVNTGLSYGHAPIASVIRNDFTDKDICRIAEKLFDHESYHLALPETFHANGEIKWYDIPKADSSFDDTYNRIDTQKYCNIEGTIDGTIYNLSFILLDKSSDNCCRMILHRDDTDCSYGYFNETAQLVASSVKELYDDTENHCIYQKNDAKKLINETLSKIGYPDYEVIDIQDAMIPQAEENEDITSSKEAPPNYDFNSYLIYAARSVNGVTPVHTDFNFEATLYDWSLSQENGMMRNDVPYSFYGYESVHACIDDDGINYLILNNPMQVDFIQEENAATLSFEQIDRIAQDYINQHTFEDTSYQVNQISYGLIRIAGETDESYTLLPAWHYVVTDEIDGYPSFSTYVIINAIDGSIYDNALGYILQYKH